MSWAFGLIVTFSVVGDLLVVVITVVLGGIVDVIVVGEGTVEDR